MLMKLENFCDFRLKYVSFVSFSLYKLFKFKNDVEDS